MFIVSFYALFCSPPRDSKPLSCLEDKYRAVQWQFSGIYTVILTFRETNKESARKLRENDGENGTEGIKAERSYVT